VKEKGIHERESRGGKDGKRRKNEWGKRSSGSNNKRRSRLKSAFFILSPR